MITEVISDNLAQYERNKEIVDQYSESQDDPGILQEFNQNYNTNKTLIQNLMKSRIGLNMFEIRNQELWIILSYAPFS